MFIGFVVNDPLRIEASSSTLAIVRRAQARGHRVALFGVEDLELDDGQRPWAHAYLFEAEDDPVPDLPPPERRTRVPLDAMDAISIRTSPGRDPERRLVHATCLNWLSVAERAGVWVFNAPAALRAAGAKDFMAALPPGTRPRMLVSRDAEAILAFAAECETGAVVKPLVGTRGEGVYRLDPADEAGARRILEELSAGGFILAQSYVTEAPAGDTRVILVGGEVLRVGEATAAVRRVPNPGEFRSNVHLGAHPERGCLDEAQKRTLAAIGPVLRAHDLYLVGADLVGNQVIELNVFATGGLTDAGTFEGCDFIDALVARIESDLAARRAAPG